jgi:hypothetical protein
LELEVLDKELEDAFDETKFAYSYEPFTLGFLFELLEKITTAIITPDVKFNANKIIIIFLVKSDFSIVQSVLCTQKK